MEKKLLPFLIFLLLTCLQLKAFNSFEFNDTTLAELDCTNVFYTVRGNPQIIERWELLGDTIIGGENILTSDGVSIAYCGNPCQPTFYSTKFPETGITYYDSLSGEWLEIETDFPVLNNGGHYEDQYFMKLYNNTNGTIDYFDGVNSTPIDTLFDETFSVADIAVDTSGKAWIFIGPDAWNPDRINVYNSEELETSIPTDFSTASAYGSVFINGQLYLGFGSQNPNTPYSLVPVLMDGDTARLGNPIPFIEANFADLASCQVLDCGTNTFEISKNEEIKIFPNPTLDEINIETNEEVLEASIFSINGSYISNSKNQTQIDVSNMASGIYFVLIKTTTGIFRKRIIKQ